MATNIHEMSYLFIVLQRPPEKHSTKHSDVLTFAPTHLGSGNVLFEGTQLEKLLLQKRCFFFLKCLFLQVEHIMNIQSQTPAKVNPLCSNEDTLHVEGKNEDHIAKKTICALGEGD